MHPSVQHTPSIHQYNVRSSVHQTICPGTPLFIHPSPIHFCFCKFFHPSSQPVSQPANQQTNQPTKTITRPVKTRYLIASITLQRSNIRFIYSLNVKFRSVMSTVQRVAMEIGNHRSLKNKTILNMQRFKLIRVTTYMSQVISKYKNLHVTSYL